MVVLKHSAVEAVLRRFHDFFVYLESILRHMKPENSRRADLPTFETEDEFLQACRDAVNRRSKTAAYPSRLDAADGELAQAEGERHEKSNGSWTVEKAEKPWKLSCNIRTALMQTRMISLLVEWRDTEDPTVIYCLLRQHMLRVGFARIR